MLRRSAALAALALVSCKKADSNEVAGSGRTPDSQQQIARVTDSGSEVGTGSGPGTATPDPVTVTDGGRDIKNPPGGKDAQVVKGSGTADPVDGQASGDSSFTLTVTPPKPVAAGAAAVARLTVRPGKGYKMNKDFPTSLKVEAPAGCTLEKSEFELEDAEAFDDHQLVFAIKATPASAGSFQVSGKIKFAVCTDATCDPKRQPISFTVAAN